MNSQQLIQQIVTYHPVFEAGQKRGWCNWLGGMSGRGDWNYLALIFAPENELRECLEELVKENEGMEGLRWNESYIGYEKSENQFLGIEFTLKDGSKQFVENKANIKI